MSYREMLLKSVNNAKKTHARQVQVPFYDMKQSYAIFLFFYEKYYLGVVMIKANSVIERMMAYKFLSTASGSLVIR